MPLQRGSISDDLSGSKSKLTLPNVTPEDSGDYKCVSQAGEWKAKWTTHFHVNVYSRQHFLNAYNFNNIQQHTGDNNRFSI